MHEMTVREALLQASSLLARTEGGSAETARADAEALLMHVLGWDKTRLLLEGDAPFPAHLADRWREAVARRAAGEPVQYIAGEQAFYGLVFEVGPAVLIPRPETELLVEAVMKRVRALFGEAGGPPSGPGPGSEGAGDGRRPLLADIGTGSGAIAVTLARLLPGWEAAACDLSPEALEVARRNARRADAAGEGRFAGRIRFLQGDLLEPLIRDGVRVDVLVSNPPYIPSGELPFLQREVRDHEPRLALDGGPDGLAVYRRIVRQIGRLPEPPRLAAFETGQGQARLVADLLAATGWWQACEIVRDYAGIERHVLMWRP